MYNTMLHFFSKTFYLRSNNGKDKAFVEFLADQIFSELFDTYSLKISSQSDLICGSCEGYKK